MVLPDGATAPTSAQVKAGQDASGSAAAQSGSITNATANTAATAAISGLTASTAYDVYVVAEDAVPNLQTAATLLEVTTLSPDTTPPTFGSGSPAASGVTTTGFTLSSTINEVGKTYYVVLASGAAAPTSAQVKAGQDASGSAAAQSGSITNATANTAATAAIGGLTASTAYDVYAVAEDAVPNLQTTPTLLAVTTATPIPAPTVTSFNPPSGSAGTVVAISGTDFTGATAVTFNGVAAASFTVNSSTSITATAPSGVTAGPLAVTTPGGTGTSGSSFLIDNPAPTLSSLSPANRLAGSGAFTLTATGTNFVAGSALTFNGADLATTFVSATSLTATVPAAAVATAGSYSVTVTNPAPGGGSSSAVAFTVLPAPLVFQDFEDNQPTIAWTYTGSVATVAGNSTGGSSPANSPFFTSSAKAWLATGASPTATFANQSLVGYSNAYVTFRLGAFSVGSTGNGMDASDNVTVEVSLDNGTTWRSTLLVGGNNNARWDYTATGVAETTYDGDNTPVPFVPSGGGVRNTDGYSTVKINLPASATQVRVRIVPTTNDGAERWSIDDVALYGSPAPAPTIVSFTPDQGLINTPVTITGTNFVSGGTGVLFNGTAATSVTFVSSTEVQALVPAGATTGPVSVAVGGQTATSTTNFTVLLPVYYAKASGALNDPATFGLNPDGSGASPTSLTDPGITLNLVNNLAPTLTASLTLGTGSKVVVGDGTAAVNLTIPAGFNLTGTLDLSANSTLTVLNTAPSFTFGAVAASSTVDYAQAGTYAVPASRTPSGGYGNLKLTSGTKTLPTGTTVIRGNFTVDNVTGYNGFAGSSSPTFTTLSLLGNFTLLGTVTYGTADNSYTLVLDGTTPQTLTGNGNAINLFRLTNNNTAGGVLAATGGSTNLNLGTVTSGGLTQNTGTSLALNGNTLALTGNGTFVGSGVLTAAAAATVDVTKPAGTSAPGTLYLGAGETLGTLTLNLADATDELFLGADLTVTNLNLTSGILVLNGRTLTSDGPIVSVAGQLRGSATSALAFTGTGSVGTLAFVNSTAARMLASLVLNRTANVTIELTNTLTVANVTLTRGVLQFTPSTRLVVTGTLTGGNANSYVNALTLPTAANATAATLTFPLGGSLGFYRPATLTVAQASNGPASGYTARLQELTGNSRGVTAPLTNVSAVRYVALSQEAGGATLTGGSVELAFGEDDGVNDAATLRLASSPNGSTAYTDLGTPTVTITATGPSFLSGTVAASITALGDFSLATNATAAGTNPLPVTLTGFTAQRQGEGALLKWTTAQEKNSAYFEVQRSTNGGQEFEAIGQVQAAGHSSTGRQYAFQDARRPVGPVYYRLRQVDRDGTATLSEVRVLSGSAVFTATVFPNPATDLLRIEAAAPVKGWRILSLAGQVLRTGSGAEAGIDVTPLAAGSYLLELTTNGGIQLTKRFVKQ
ncbi:hypothetical protein DLM85_20970 [Hymenobacter edaphi]|uniref:IPT/TIG domain-containing protein n=1 Tax=Hymenobacter edaphi TaxID=2211146 RepID=A0A328B7S5_9BACT|nr:hypothetical protein DLM85_20970 [Hymenobacter edaphi]